MVDVNKDNFPLKKCKKMNISISDWNLQSLKFGFNFNYFFLDFTNFKEVQWLKLNW